MAIPRLFGVIIAATFFALTSQTAVSQMRATRSEWRYFVGQANSADVSPRADIAESRGRGTLLLNSCTGKTAVFADGIEVRFWTADRDGARVAWLRWKEADQTRTLVIAMEDGMEGWTFEFNTEGSGASMLDADRFQICPSRESKDADCRSFATKGLKAALKRVCTRTTSGRIRPLPNYAGL